jgi:hypothetical protein
MLRTNQVQVKLPCGATVILTVRIERRGCTTGGADCPLAVDVAGLIWLAVQDEEAERSSPQ